MAQAPVHGMPPGDCIVDRQEQPGATLSPGATAAAGAAGTPPAPAAAVAPDDNVETKQRSYELGFLEKTNLVYTWLV